jgi:hypothetical protein
MYFNDLVMDIKRNNYETFFLLYLDRELGPADMQEVEKFLSENKDLQKEFINLQKTVFLPVEIVFEQKESLLREEKKRRIVPLYPVRIAAAVAFLILGSWYIITQVLKNRAAEMIGNGQATQINVSTKKDPVKGNTVAKNADRSRQNGEQGIVNQIRKKAITENKYQGKTTNQNNAVSKTRIANPGMKSQNDLTGRNKQDRRKDKLSPQRNPDQQNLPNNEVSDEPGPATPKSNGALELQSAEMRTGRDPEQISTISGTRAPVLILAAANSKDPIRYENAVLKEQDSQADNAISVVALNDRNKAITGFFKKLTKRAPADGNSRKLRVSVFQISY